MKTETDVIADLADENAPVVYEDNGTTTSEYVENIEENISSGSQQQMIENYNRNILRLLPSRLAAEIHRSTTDELVLRSWKQFTHERLHDILREILVDMAPMQCNLEAPSSTEMHDAVPATRISHRTTATSTEPVVCSGLELFDFEKLCD